MWLKRIPLVVQIQTLFLSSPLCLAADAANSECLLSLAIDTIWRNHWLDHCSSLCQPRWDSRLFVEIPIQQCLVLFVRWEVMGHDRYVRSFHLHALCSTIAFVFLSTGPTVSGSAVRGKVGQSVTVPCFYSVEKTQDITSMCWGRGSCPASKCDQTIIWTDGWKVTEQYNHRYMLKGNLLTGDVSLTIVNAEEADSGTYCCRVEVRGLFNDQKNNLNVVIEKGEYRGAFFMVHSATEIS